MLLILIKLQVLASIYHGVLDWEADLLLNLFTLQIGGFKSSCINRGIFNVFSKFTLHTQRGVRICWSLWPFPLIVLLFLQFLTTHVKMINLKILLCFPPPLACYTVYFSKLSSTSFHVASLMVFEMQKKKRKVICWALEV